MIHLGVMGSAHVASGPVDMTNAIANPSRLGYPDATNTGVPNGTVLTRCPEDVTSGPGWDYDPRGWAYTTTDGAVIENLLFSTGLEVMNNNVTVRNCRFDMGGEAWCVGFRHVANPLVHNCTMGIPGGLPRLMVAVKDIYGDSTGMQVLRNNILNCSTGVQIASGLIQDNYIHDLAYQTGDHLNGTTSGGGSGLVIRHNTVLNSFGQTDCISLFQDFGTQSDCLIEDNLVAGGGWTIYGGGGGFGPTSNIRILNNRFSHLYYPNCGSYGPLAWFSDTDPGNEWSGNYWDHDLSPL